MIVRALPLLALLVVAGACERYDSTRDEALKRNVAEIRGAIARFKRGEGRYPQSLDELVSSGYMREVPIDPFTGQKDWAITTGEDPNSLEGSQGVTDVHSASAETSTEGTPYSEW